MFAGRPWVQDTIWGTIQVISCDRVTSGPRERAAWSRAPLSASHTRCPCGTGPSFPATQHREAPAPFRGLSDTGLTREGAAEGRQDALRSLHPKPGWGSLNTFPFGCGHKEPAWLSHPSRAAQQQDVKQTRGYRCLLRCVSRAAVNEQDTGGGLSRRVQGAASHRIRS